MKRLVFAVFLLLSIRLCAQEKLVYHTILTDPQGNIKPWYQDDLGTAFDHAILSVWHFWDTMRTDLNGLPYYMNHQVWKAGYNDNRGLGGDQVQMAMSSWQLLYAYSGDERVKQNMKFLADYTLTHSLSPSNCLWPNLPFPYNTLIYSGQYDGDMVIGPGYLQPDKAGSLGLELVHLYKMSSKDFFLQSTSGRYLAAAKAIAETLLRHLGPGDANHSPLPFKVNAYTGQTGKLKNNNTDGTIVGEASYTSNWCPTMELLMDLQTLDKSKAALYRHGLQVLLDWMKKYPLQNNRWGPFFEDVQGWSDTQINAVTFARFMMDHRAFFPEWKKQVEAIFRWVHQTVGNDKWKAYGVHVINEQTVYQTPGESHVSREGAAELQYALASGDTTRRLNGIRQLIWATYAVDTDGKNCFPFDEVWLTDGYGDFVKHYLRAMAYDPALAPAGQDHLLSSSSVIQQADYQGLNNKFHVTYPDVDDPSKVLLFYQAFDSSGQEVLRFRQKPSRVLLENRNLQEVGAGLQEGYSWAPLPNGGGVLTIWRKRGYKVTVLQ